MIKFLKAFWLSTALLTALTAIGYPAFAENYPPTQGLMSGFVLLKDRTPAPDTPFLDTKDNVRHFTDFGDKVLLVNFWATWCAPCIREMPALDQLQQEMGSENFQVIAISQDFKGAAKAEPFLREKLGLKNLDLFLDSKLKLGKSLNVAGLPTTFAIDKAGKIVGAYTGPAEWNSPDAKALIQYLIDE